MALSQVFRWPFTRKPRQDLSPPRVDDGWGTRRLYRAAPDPAGYAGFTPGEIGRIRALKVRHDRPASDVAVADRRCRICGCSDGRACAGGCWWVEPDLCSACGVRP